jgi:hypothetical protein
MFVREKSVIVGIEAVSYVRDREAIHVSYFNIRR